MRQILILGAGKSSGVLIDYLAEHAAAQNWHITVADISREQAVQKTKGRAHTTATGFDFYNDTKRAQLITKANIVVSMLPAAMHTSIAQECLLLKKNLVTPSYISDAMKKMDADVKKQQLIFMNEVGLDPGIDHMSTMQMLDKLKAEGAEITGYQSHCGGLVAKESDTNKWHYKFTWNPRNVVLAGQGEGHIQYLKNGKKVLLTYEELFSHTSVIKIKGHGKFESYPNRDSLKYIKEYGLQNVKTMYRGTLRVPPFCKGWNTLIQLGFTAREEVDTKNFANRVNHIINNRHIVTDKSTPFLLQEIDILQKLRTLKNKTFVPYEFLQSVLEKAWQLSEHDKDRVVMFHEIEYKLKRKKYTLQSSMVYTGKDAQHTAMAATVGLPVGMVVKLILNNQLKKHGVLMPKYAQVYDPVLNELKNYGVRFKETTN